MSITLNSGNWYIDGVKSDCIIGVDLALTTESETSELTCISPRFSADVEMSFECEMTMNKNLMQQLCYPPSSDNYDLEAYIPIMIQARWHKKPRIRKKWLKRYGMKSDTVKIVIHVNSMSINPLEGYLIETEFKFDDFQYELRPDQKRRDILWYITK